jgi:hypothetical protein
MLSASCRLNTLLPGGTALGGSWTHLPLILSSPLYKMSQILAQTFLASATLCKSQGCVWRSTRCAVTAQEHVGTRGSDCKSDCESVRGRSQASCVHMCVHMSVYM